MTKLREQFFSLCANETFRKLFDGENAPEYIDYWFRPIDESNRTPMPKDLVSDRNIIPLFCGCDSYSFYCMEPETGMFFEICPEEPWPPVYTADNWIDFQSHYLNRITEDKEEDYINEVKQILL